jgi:hypothetical protein
MESVRLGSIWTGYPTVDNFKGTVSRGAGVVSNPHSRKFIEGNWCACAYEECGGQAAHYHIEYGDNILKGTQAWDNFDLFLPKSNPYIPLVNFRTKFRFFYFDFAKISKFENFRSDWAVSIRGTKFFGEISKNFFLQNVHLGPVTWIPRRFFKISIFYSRNMHFKFGFFSNFRKL